MQYKKFFSVLIIILIISNALLISFFIIKKPESNKPGKEGPRELIIEHLHFDEKQIAQYEDLIRWHRANIEPRDSIIRTIKKELYTNIDIVNEAKQDSLIKEISEIQYEIEKIHIQHFRDIEALCREDQKKYFIELRSELSNLFGKRKK